MEQVRDGQIEVGFRHEGLEDLFMHLDKVTNRMVVALIAGTGVIGSALLGAFVESGPARLRRARLLDRRLRALDDPRLWLARGVIRSGRL
jgi:ubiquinone biosynthesis protein